MKRLVLAVVLLAKSSGVVAMDTSGGSSDGRSKAGTPLMVMNFPNFHFNVNAGGGKQKKVVPFSVHATENTGTAAPEIRKRAVAGFMAVFNRAPHALMPAQRAISATADGTKFTYGFFVPEAKDKQQLRIYTYNSDAAQVMPVEQQSMTGKLSDNLLAQKFLSQQEEQ